MEGSANERTVDDARDLAEAAVFVDVKAKVEGIVVHGDTNLQSVVIYGSYVSLHWQSVRWGTGPTLYPYFGLRNNRYLPIHTITETGRQSGLQ